MGWHVLSVNIFFSRTTELILTKFGMQHMQGKETRNYKFHDPPSKGKVILGKKCKIQVFLKKSSSLLRGMFQTKKVYSNDDQGRVNPNCKFHDLLGRGSCARVWPNKSYSEIALLLYSHAQNRQTYYTVMMTEEGSTKIVNFVTPGTGVLVLGCGHISHMVKMHHFF